MEEELIVCPVCQSVNLISDDQESFSCSTCHSIISAQQELDDNENLQGYKV